MLKNTFLYRTALLCAGLSLTALCLSGCLHGGSKQTEEKVSEKLQTETQTETEAVLLVEMTEAVSEDMLPDNTDPYDGSDILTEDDSASVPAELNALITDGQ